GLTASGDAWCWGPTPLPVSGGLTFTKLDAGQEHTCGVIASGTAYCFGRGDEGQLGNGSFTSDLGFLTPVLVVGGRTWTAVSAGFVHSCGLTTDNDAYCWGNNALGTLGDGTTTDRSAPTLVTGGLAFLSITADNSHTCGVVADASAYCWGGNQLGQLGIGSTISQTAPAQVSGGFGWQSVSVSLSGVGAHTCGITSGNVVYCWGTGDRGQLGNGSYNNMTLPVRVLG